MCNGVLENLIFLFDIIPLNPAVDTQKDPFAFFVPVVPGKECSILALVRMSELKFISRLTWGFRYPQAYWQHDRKQTPLSQYGNFVVVRAQLLYHHEHHIGKDFADGIPKGIDENHCASDIDRR